MEQSFVPRNLNEALEPVNETAGISPVVRRTPSYHPTRWAIANRILDVVDSVTNGRAAAFQRLFSFLFIGGSAAVVNLAVFTILFQFVHPSAFLFEYQSFTHNLISSTISFEIALLINFSLNDYFTFRHLDGHRRSWIARCARFHLTGIGGYILTWLFQYSFFTFLGMPPIFAQAASIFCVLIYNFTFHHLFTYRHLKSTTEKHRAISSAMIQPVVEAADALLEEEDTRKLVAASSGSTR